MEYGRLDPLGFSSCPPLSVVSPFSLTFLPSTRTSFGHFRKQPNSRRLSKIIQHSRLEAIGAFSQLFQEFNAGQMYNFIILK
jgi:hypothetical protein